MVMSQSDIGFLQHDRAWPAHSVSLQLEQDGLAIQAWLKARASRSAQTERAYRREAQRLWVWLREQQLSLQRLTLSDLHRYYDHLRQPPAHWLRPRKPFANQVLLDTQLMIAGLNENALAYTRRILSLLFGYLYDAGYVTRNWVKLSERPHTISHEQHQRVLTPEQWQWLWAWLNSRPRHTVITDGHFMRDRWLMYVLYQTGLRREEVAQAVMGDVRPQGAGWVLSVVGKGRKQRLITLHRDWMHELAEYRYWLGLLQPIPAPQEQTPLVCALTPRDRLRALTPRAIGLTIQQIGQQAAAVCDNPYWAVQFAQLSTHWLRHTNATHRLLAGASLETTQDELGHADPKTTRLYVKTLDQQRRADVDKFVKLQQPYAL
jgi:site-specific recombinase XerD